MTIEDLSALETRTRALLASDRVTEPTRRVLLERLETAVPPPRALSPAQMSTLRACCLRMIPEPELVERIDLAGRLDARLADAVPRGWRYAEAPDDLSLQRAGLDALDAAAKAEAEAGVAFADLRAADQDRLLHAACEGELHGDIPLDRWFEELLSALVELYYAHPLVQLAIGYDGMADAQGVQAVSPQTIAEEAIAEETIAEEARP